MPHTHHSHSGQFCNHAVDTLRDVVHHAFHVKRMSTVALTEHIPRPAAHLYPGEADIGWDPESQKRIFAEYVEAALALRAEVAAARDAPDADAAAKSRNLLVGFEGEWIDADADVAAGRLREILAQYGASFDLWIGSVHHVAGEAIDYDGESYARAAALCGGEDGLWMAYFDAQFALITAMQPPVVAHFDLIRLKSGAPDRDLTRVAGGMVWARIMRNLHAIKDYGGVLEVNSSGLRKGLEAPYPRREVLRAWRNIDGDVVLSDDSHGIAQVGACYEGVVEALEASNFKQVIVLEKGESVNKPGFRRIELKQLKQHAFWSADTTRSAEQG